MVCCGHIVWYMQYLLCQADKVYDRDFIKESFQLPRTSWHAGNEGDIFLLVILVGSGKRLEVNLSEGKSLV